MSNQAAETNMDKGNTGIDKNGVTVDLHASNGLLKNKPSITVPERISSGFGSMHRSIPIQSPYQRSPAMRRHFSSMKVRRKSQLKKTASVSAKRLKTPGSSMFLKGKGKSRRSMTKDHVPIPQQLEGAQKFIPKILLRKIIEKASEGSSVGEDSNGGNDNGPRCDTFEAACVFFDISGFSSLASRLQREELHADGRKTLSKPGLGKTSKFSDASLLTKSLRKRRQVLKNVTSQGMKMKSLVMKELTDKAIPSEENKQSSKNIKRGRSSFSTITTKHTGEGAEKLASAITGFFTSLIEKIHEAGGDIIKFAGDALICLWSADSIAKDNSLGHLVYHAIHCGFGVAKDVVDLEDGSGSLKLHVCVGSGEMSLICLGGVQNRWEFFINGEGYRQSTDGVDLSKPGEIVVSDDSFDKLCEMLDVTDPKKRSELAQKIPDSRYYRMTSLRSTIKPAKVLSLPTLQAHHVKGMLEYTPLCIAHAVHHGTSHAADVRNVTIVFVKFKGLPSLQKDKQKSLETLHEFFKTVEKAIYSQRGILRQFVVDDKGAVAVIVVGFPPLSYANQAARGVTIALRIRSNSDKFGFSISAGVTTGTVFCGNVGSAKRCEYAAVGHKVNLSARLMSKDKKGQVYVCQDTAKAAAAEYRFDALPKALVLKGCEGPVPVYTPIQRTLPFNLLHCKATKLVGRQSDLDTLMSHVANFSRFHATAVFSFPGVGKTTLIVNLMRRLQQEEQFKVVGTAGRIADQQSQYYPFRRVYRSLLGIDSNHVDHFVSCADRDRKRSVKESVLQSKNLARVILYLKANTKVQDSLWAMKLVIPELIPRFVDLGVASEVFERNVQLVDSGFSDAEVTEGLANERRVVKECNALGVMFFALLDYWLDTDNVEMRNIKAFSRFILLIDDADMLDANSVNLLTQLCTRQYDKFKVFVTAASPKISLRNDNPVGRSISDAVIQDDEGSGPLISPLVKDRRLSGIRRNQNRRFSAILSTAHEGTELGNDKYKNSESFEDTRSPTTQMLEDEHYPPSLARSLSSRKSPSGTQITREGFLKSIASGISVASVKNLFVQENEEQKRIYKMVDLITQQVDSQITLRPLEWSCIVEVLENESGGAFSKDILTYIRNACSGKLSSAIDVYGTLISEDLIVKEVIDDKIVFHFSQDVNSGSLPSKMTDLWKRKVDRMDHPTKCVARMISVVGTEVDLHMLLSLNALGFSFDDINVKEAQLSLIECLKNLVEAGVLVWDASTAVAKESTHVIVSGIGESLFYSFSSVAARDGIYNSMTFSDRQKLHRRVMAFYEETHFDEIELYGSTVAYHAEAAKEYKRAMTCLEDSARYDEYNGDYLDAIIKYGDCIRLAEIDGESALQFGMSSEVVLVEWLCRIAALHLRLGKPGIAHITLEHLVDVIDESLKERKSERGWGGCALCCAGSEERELQKQRVLASDIATRSNDLTRMVGSNAQKQDAAEKLADDLIPRVTSYKCKITFDPQYDNAIDDRQPVSFRREESNVEDLGQSTVRTIKSVRSMFALDTIKEVSTGTQKSGSQDHDLSDHDLHSHNMHLAVMDIHGEDDHI